MNKLIVSIVLAIFLVLGINKITDVIYYVEKPEKSAYQVDSVVSVASTTSTESNSESSESGDIMALFASVNAADGARIFKNVRLATVLLKVEQIKLDLLCGELLEEKLAVLWTINIQKQWLPTVSHGHLKK